MRRTLFFFLLLLLFSNVGYLYGTPYHFSFPETCNQKFKNSYKKFKDFTSKGLKEFIAKQPDLQEVETVFYPFGGPDVLYPFLIYPNVKKIILIGLERKGFIPKKVLDLYEVGSLLKRSFFITADMGKVSSRHKVGTLNHLLAQLFLLDAKGITIDFPPNSTPHKLEVFFTYNGLERKIIYFQKDLMNNETLKQFLEKIENEPFQGVLLKATSYTLHRPEFKQIKNFILQKSKIIVQDDSGIPLNFFSRSYEVKKFGHYEKPYGESFSGYTQQDLKKLPSVEKEKLPFCFGYGCGRQPSLLMIAKKIR